MNLGHDRTKPIGYTMLTGIYMEPGKAYDYKIFCEEHKKELDTLIEKLGDVLSDKFRVAPVGQAVAIKDKDIVYRFFPKWSETIKDGLADVWNLEPICTKNESREKGFLVPGVYQKEGYLLFAHQFFRRSLSILNTTNEEFLIHLKKCVMFRQLNYNLHLTWI